MAKKDKATKLPKKVGGVKLPKQLRKSAGVVADFAQNPIAREVVSAALVAGATALARRKTKATASPAGTSKVSGELDSLVTQGKEVGNIVAQGINAFFGALLKPAEKMAAMAVEPAATKPVTAKAAPAKPAAGKTASAKPAAAKPATTRRRAATRTTSGRPRAKPGPKPKS